ncbi:hypothetical protein HF086_011093 [Spodoptera exigua]|uniref:Uncharacterized protein n=1 Tax=Spodoptera exigua TaxID=7107 RepID=A0A922SG55_SPOEX|nr:hypothetical protein HF086_011093 [Spodoptera exigua]
MRNPRSDLCSRYITIFIVVSCYWVVSIATVFVNKTLLSSQEVALEAPLFITWFQCNVSFSICYSLSKTGGIPGVFTFPKGTPWNWDVMKRVTSPLTHNISGTAKACAQTVLATQWYNETKNVLWWTSNIIVLFSSALYARFKQQEMEENSRKPVPEEKQSLVHADELSENLRSQDTVIFVPNDTVDKHFNADGKIKVHL